MKPCWRKYITGCGFWELISCLYFQFLSVSWLWLKMWVVIFPYLLPCLPWHDDSPSGTVRHNKLPSIFGHGILSLQWKVKMINTLLHLINAHPFYPSIQESINSKKNFFPPFLEKNKFSIESSPTRQLPFPSTFHCWNFQLFRSLLDWHIFHQSPWKCLGRFLLIMISLLSETWKY